jgi:hypothetical protein
MGEIDRRAHWGGVYAAKGASEVSWFEHTPGVSLALIEQAGTRREHPVIDVGGGASHLVDALLERGFSDISVLDISGEALAKSRARLGEGAGRVRWIEADIVAWQPGQQYRLWHDRAVFHFLTDARDRRAYVQALLAALPVGGQAIIATFAPDGPERCSGLPVVRYDAAALGRALGDSLELQETRPHLHRTPWGSTQSFQFSRFRRAR